MSKMFAAYMAVDSSWVLCEMCTLCEGSPNFPGWESKCDYYLLQNPWSSCPTELGLRGDAAQDHGQAVSMELSGKCVSSVENIQSQPLLSGVMGSLDRVRRHQQSASSPGLLPFSQEERYNL